MEKIFKRLGDDLKSKDELREKIIVESRPIIQLSKKAIYDLHRDDIKEAKKKLDEAEKLLKKLPDNSVGAYSAAIQEYIEAKTYYHYIIEGNLLDVDVDSEDYLMGLCDLTGELGRRCVNLAIHQKYEEIEKIRVFVDKIYLEFMGLDLRNGELRKKSDAIKWNLKKIEDIMYDLKIRDKI